MAWGSTTTTSLRLPMLKRDLRQEFAAQNRKQHGPNVGRSSLHGSYATLVKASTTQWINKAAWQDVVERMHHDFTQPLPPLPAGVSGVPSSRGDHAFAYPLLEQDNGVIVQLYQTDIIFWDRQRLRLRAAGWETTSTQAWLNEALRGIGGDRVWVANHRLGVHTLPQWMIVGDWRPLVAVTAWYDNITFDHVTGRLVTKPVAPEMKVLNQEPWRELRAVLRSMRALYEPYYALHLGQTNNKVHDDMRLPEAVDQKLDRYTVYAMAKAMLDGKPCPLKGTYHEYLSLYWFNGYTWRNDDVAASWRRAWDRIAKQALAQDPDVYLSRVPYPIGSSDSKPNEEN